MGRGKSIFAITVHRLLLIIAAGLLVLSYISFLFNPAKAWFMTLFGLAFPLLLILNIFLLLWAILRRSKAFIIPLLALLPTVFIVGRYYRPSHEEVEKTASGGLKVLSYNVGRFSSRGFQSKKACADSVMEYIRRQSPDVICLQEFYMDDADKVKSYLSKKFRGYDIEYFVFPTDNGCYGNVTLSRHSIKNRGHIDFNESANLAIFCDFEVGDVRYRVYNCHLQSYGISLASIAKSIKDSGERKKTESKLRASIRMRPRQVGQIMDNIEECPYPAILVGGFQRHAIILHLPQATSGKEGLLH